MDDRVEVHGGLAVPYCGVIPDTVTAAVLAAGAAGGMADLGYHLLVDDIITQSATVVEMLQWIASAVVGSRAVSLGLLSLMIGVALHLLLSFAWAAIYVGIAIASQSVRDRPVAAGLVFGAVLHAVMWFLVLPLSLAIRPTGMFQFASYLVSHTLFFGIPVAWATTTVLSKRDVIGQ